MNKEEKSQEIINAIRKVIQKRPMVIAYENERLIAIESSLICIDEIIKELEQVEFNYGLKESFKEQSLSKTVIPYWNGIKQEILKLKTVGGIK